MNIEFLIFKVNFFKGRNNIYSLISYGGYSSRSYMMAIYFVWRSNQYWKLSDLDVNIRYRNCDSSGPSYRQLANSETIICCTKSCLDERECTHFVYEAGAKKCLLKRSPSYLNVNDVSDDSYVCGFIMNRSNQLNPVTGQ